jgi:hypothetical protein
MLAVAKTPDQVFRLLSNDINTNKLGELLLGLKYETHQPVPGQIEIRDAG